MSPCEKDVQETLCSLRFASRVQTVELGKAVKKVDRSASPTPTPNTSVAWVHREFGIPAITYELGDDTDRALLAQIAGGAAEEMMKLLLALKDDAEKR